MRKLFLKFTRLATVIALFAANCAHAIPTFNMTPGATPISRDIYDLHMTIFSICVVIGIIVFGVMFYSLFKHRKSMGHKPAEFHENTKLEIFWAIIPFLILVVMGVPATKVLNRMNDTAQSDVNIKITGYQWKWKYEYLDEGISYFSNLSTPYAQTQNKAPKNEWYLLEVDKPLVVPIHRKIRFLVTSNDVIHSWWVPALGIKRDAIPGFIYEAWARIDKPGTYRGQCAELCGINHGFMPIVVVAKTEEDYEKWVAANAPGATSTPGAPQASITTPITLTKDELIKNGENVYNANCAVCHKPDGSGMPPAFPALKGSKIATGPVANHIDIVVHGKPGTAMQAFGKQLSDADIAAVITYERNSWGNDKAGKDAGGIVQAADIAAGTTGAVKTSTPGSATPAASTPATSVPGVATPSNTPASPAPTTATSASGGTKVPAAAPTTLTKAELIKNGENVYDANCVVCHKADGSGMPPTFPSLKGSKIATGPVANHIDIVLNGKPGTAMQAFGKQLNDADIAAVITYERNSWGNDKAGKDAGGVVQASDIAAARKK